MNKKKDVLSEIDRHNMAYLELDERQYVVHKKLMGIPVKDWPAACTRYIRKHHGEEPICGDALNCWLAEWIRSRGDYVDAIAGKAPEAPEIVRLLRFD